MARPGASSARSSPRSTSCGRSARSSSARLPTGSRRTARRARRGVADASSSSAALLIAARASGRASLLDPLHAGVAELLVRMGAEPDERRRPRAGHGSALAFLILALDLIAPDRRRRRAGRGLYGLAIGRPRRRSLAGVLLAWTRRIRFTDAFVLDAFALLREARPLAAGAPDRARACIPTPPAAAVAHRSGEVDRAALVRDDRRRWPSARRASCSPLFVAFELLSLPLYVLAALDKGEARRARGRASRSSSSAACPPPCCCSASASSSRRPGRRSGCRCVRWPADPLIASGASAACSSGFGFKIAIFPFYALGARYVPGRADADRRVPLRRAEGCRGRGTVPAGTSSCSSRQASR